MGVPLGAGPLSGSSNHQIIEQLLRCGGYFGNGAGEDRLVVNGRFAEPADLADVLSGGGFDLVGRDGCCAFAQALD